MTTESIEVISVKAASDVLGISPQSVRNYYRQKRLIGCHIKDKLFVTVDSVVQEVTRSSRRETGQSTRTA